MRWVGWHGELATQQIACETYCVRAPALFLYSDVWDLHPSRSVDVYFPETIIEPALSSLP